MISFSNLDFMPWNSEIRNINLHFSTYSVNQHSVNGKTQWDIDWIIEISFSLRFLTHYVSQSSVYYVKDVIHHLCSVQKWIGN